ncbi:MAG: transporter [Planctomycetes bacterium]|nr:transporter [Planctomycetota bacterium]
MRAGPNHLMGRAALLVGAWLLVLPFPARSQGVGEVTVRDSNVGYIDPAPLFNLVRLRFDASYDNNRPSRAEFFYPRAGSGGPGPRFADPSVDFQEGSAYAEAVLVPRLSAFVEVPVRFFNGTLNDNATGLSDINAGVKFSLLAGEDTAATLQLRNYAPTGEADRGLGTNHVTLEPAFLLSQKLSEALTLEGELRAWLPIGGTPFAGNIVRYGIGASYRLPCTESLWLAPVAELVGWTVLDGKEAANSAPGVIAIQDAAGDTILNAKVGLRTGLGEVGSLYVGYGRPLTGEVWYKNTIRVELRLAY